MSTTANIIYCENGTEHGIFCTYDGHLLENGVADILLRSYMDLDKIRDLCKLGNLMTLGDDIKINPNRLCQTYAYHRDGKEEIGYKMTSGEYQYKFDGGQWHVKSHITDMVYVPLTPESLLQLREM